MATTCKLIKRLSCNRPISYLRSRNNLLGTSDFAMKNQSTTILVKGTAIRLQSDFISLTDMCSGFDSPSDTLLERWLRQKYTVEYIGKWEMLHNPGFKPAEFEVLFSQAGSNTFYLSVSKWVGATAAIGIISKKGRGGGTYAHKDIAFQFASWLSVDFHLLLVKEYQVLLEEKYGQEALEWKVRRTLAKVNYHLHTEAVKSLLPPRIEKSAEGFFYANEADLLNLALFGMTAKDWKAQNPDKQGNMRDYASTEQLLVLANLENLNAEYIKSGMNASERLALLNERAIEQLDLLMRYEAGRKFVEGI